MRYPMTEIRDAALFRDRRAWRTFPDAHPPVLGRIGKLETRLACSESEIRAAQRLRYEVFFREMAARPGSFSRLARRDIDRWDGVCDHLLVIDREEGRERIVGTYRLFRQAVSRLSGRSFYTQQEFDIDQVMARHANLDFMELGRSCVLPQWRTRRTIELLWQGIWAHVLAHRIDVMVGCASFPGVDALHHREALAFLHAHALAAPQWQAGAVGREKMPLDAFGTVPVDARRAFHALPPLIKGYLRLGARFGAEAVIDRRFGTVDVLVILPVADIDRRYLEHYGSDAGRYAGHR